MAAIADLSTLLNRITGGNSGTPEKRTVIKNGRHNGAAAQAPVSGRWSDLGPMEGTPGASWAGTLPDAEESLSRTSPGALGQSNPGGGRQKWLVSGAVTLGGSSGTVMLYDRLAHVGETDSAVDLSGTVVTAQVTTLDPPARANTSGTTTIGNEIWVEITSQIGVTATTATVAYNDQDGNSATSEAFSIGGTGLREVHRMIQVPLAAGDTGVLQVDNIDLLATTGTAGKLALVLLRPIAFFHVPVAGGAAVVDFLSGVPTSVPEIRADANLQLMFLASSTTVPTVYAEFNFIEV